ncbi:hypothetical protein GCM10011374_03040 [Kocuria dechangensis]|uniref:Uncharacterized protein n=1 Tax=Kocuria dechangensis TaxID=1176249 RepID=A0A917LME4_9MICC|nr:hypothetical protein [Kocuria dechangensis]GGG44070.1 hypothetical protein GCM10011374_03040 [Kocuria dechangensis]
MTITAHRRRSATERLEQLRDFGSSHERAPSRPYYYGSNRLDTTVHAYEWFLKHPSPHVPLTLDFFPQSRVLRAQATITDPPVGSAQS